jgi:CcmD family protein
MDNLGFLGIAYALVWIGFVAYLYSIGRRLRKLEERLNAGKQE